MRYELVYGGSGNFAGEVTLKDIKVILMESYNIEPNEESVIEFQEGVKNLLIKNIGAGVVYINFDNNIADTSGFPLEVGESLTGISCNKLRLFSQSSSEVKILGGE